MSNYITNEIINEIRNKVDIVEIISNYLPLTKKGKNYFGVCPFHDDHSPSMSVSYEKQIYTCFSCGATGNVFTFVSDYEHISFYDAVKLLGNKVGYTLESKQVYNKINEDYKIYETAYKFYQNNLNTALGKNALEYLTNRKINQEAIKKFGIGLSIPRLSLTEFLLKQNISLDKLISLGLTNENSFDIFTNRIMFPLYDLSGNVVAFSGRIYNTKDSSKYVNTKETDIFKKGNILYNYHNAREHLKKNDYVLIFEGFMDVIRASTIGINNCVATMGTAFTKQHASIIKKMTDNVILCFDGDNAGEEATNSTIKVLEEFDIAPKIIRLEDNLDPDEYIIKNGKDAFLSKINKAMNIVDYKMQILKTGKNLQDINEVSKYVDSMLKELVKIDDEILIDLSLKKINAEYKIEYSILKDKLDTYKKSNKVKIKDSIKIEKKIIKRDKYYQAALYLLFYMLKYDEIIVSVSNRVASFPTDEMKSLRNEIICYYDRYGTFILADFITYIKDFNELNNLMNEVINLNIKEEYSNEEIEDYINLLLEYTKKNRIEKLQQRLKDETDPIKQAKILKEILEIRGVKK